MLSLTVDSPGRAALMPEPPPALDAAGLAAEPAVVACLESLQARYGDAVLAVILYGSFLRGKRDTVLDFYVLLDSYAPLGRGLLRFANQLLPPNVYFLTCGANGGDDGGVADQSYAAKYATLTLTRFEHALSSDFNTYFWSRFAQPSVVVYARDTNVGARLRDVSLIAGRRLLERTVPMLPQDFTAEQAWAEAFSLTYGCELRAETSERARELVTQYATELNETFDTLRKNLPIAADDDGRWRNLTTPAQRRQAAYGWALRRAQGKLLSCARLVKAAFTFNDPLTYVLWKVERHSGIRVEPSDRQRRHPLIFSWGLLWRLYRCGGFR